VLIRFSRQVSGLAQLAFTPSFNATSTTTDLTVVGPRPHSEQQVGLAPVTLGVKVGGRLSVDGHELKVLRINSDESIDYAVR
jgi:hypothetical protein